MAESFIAGFAYGATTVFVGQPLDTIKTLQQTSTINNTTSNASTSSKTKPIKTHSMQAISKHLYETGGIKAFYRGGIPLLLGGGLMRSAQFGVYSYSLEQIRYYQNCTTTEQERIGGIIDPQVVVAGICGGIGRGIVEGPFEMMKVRQQVQTSWNYSQIGKGFGATIIRNAGLFSSFAIYMDLSDRIVEGGLSPFFKGGICANLAWLTIWPLDVTKSRLQSGKFENKSLGQILSDIIKSGHLFQGLIPGLTRSFIANGCSMVVYTHVETSLKERWK